MMRLLLFLLCLYCPVFAWGQSPFSSVARYAILQDFDTGEILYSRNADKRMYPASMTKIMTAYLVFEELKSGRLGLEDLFIVSEKARAIGGSRMFVELGSRITVEDLLRGIIVQSGNDASIVVAENIGGSEFDFALMMNEKARELGMENTHFVNASGWPHDDHYTTAEDLLILARATISNFSEYYGYYSEGSFAFGGIHQANRNPLLDRDLGVDGLKTGHTEASGYGLVGSVVMGDRRLLMVVNGLSSKADRALHSQNLLEWGLFNFSNYRVLLSGDVVGSGEVSSGILRDVSLVSGSDIVLTLAKRERRLLSAELHYDSPISAPIEKGDKVGVIRFSVGKKGIGEYPIFSGEDVSQVGFFDNLLLSFDRLLWGS